MCIYIYNSVLTSANAPLNATKMPVMKGSHGQVVRPMFGPSSILTAVLFYTLLFATTVVPVMNGHPRDQEKCPYMTGDRSSEGRVGGAKRNTPYTTTSPPAILIRNTMSCIVIIMYAVVIGPKINTS